MQWIFILEDHLCALAMCSNSHAMTELLMPHSNGIIKVIFAFVGIMLA
jgi:hypothetical protein